MNERYTLNVALIRDNLEREHRKTSYLEEKLRVSGSLVDKMLSGHVPKERTLEKLAALFGVEVNDLLVPKEAA